MIYYGAVHKLCDAILDILRSLSSQISNASIPKAYALA